MTPRVSQEDRERAALIIGGPGPLDREYRAAIALAIATVRAEEREACAKVCDFIETVEDRAGEMRRSETAHDCAAAIRAREEK